MRREPRGRRLPVPVAVPAIPVVSTKSWNSVGGHPISRARHGMGIETSVQEVEG
jgi:hypothetical protein